MADPFLIGLRTPGSAGVHALSMSDRDPAKPGATGRVGGWVVGLGAEGGGGLVEDGGRR